MSVLARGILALALVALPVMAQQTTATLLGTITDSTGAIMPNVTVRATSLSTNASREAKTDDSGAYSIPFLPAGEYSVTAQLQGFQAQRVERVTLQVSQTARLDFAMKVGEVSETVNVEASAALLQTENSTVGTVIDAAKIVDLPLNGRNFVQLAQLIPGVNAGTPGSITVRRGRGSIGQQDSPFGSTGMNANGSRDTANRFFIDGIEFMDYDAMTYSFSPSVDSLAEFKVETSSYGADSGGAPGGYVNMLTKRGGNVYHGTLWEFNRNDALTQTYDAIAGREVAPPRLNRNQYGVNLSGPLSIPKVYNAKDKTFFFFNWEAGRLAQGAVPGFRIVPTQAQRNGDLSGLVDARTRQPLVLRDPLNIGIVGNVIPRSRLSPEAQAFLQFQPLPNTSSGNFNYLSQTFSAVSKQDSYTGRVDHRLTSNDQISFRYIYNDTFEAGVPFWGNDERNNLGTTRNWGGSWIRTISPSIVNEFRTGWHEFAEFEVFGTTNKPEFDVVGKMNLPGVSRLAKEYGPPSIGINGPDGVFNMYDLNRQIGPRDRSNGIMQFDDGLSLQVGKHFLRVGAQIARRTVTFEQARDPRGSFSFDGTYTGSALADFLLGYVRSGRLNPAHTSTDLSNWWQSYYVNDDWKVTSRLTLNLGLRYDIFGRYVQSDDKFVNIEQNGLIAAGVVTTSTSQFGRTLMAGDHNNFGPRIGFAWRPGFLNDAVLRGGYGIYYTPQISNAIFAMAEGAQATAGANVIGNIAGAPNLFFNNAFTSAASTGVYNFAVSNDPYMRDSYIQQWNLNVQKKLPGNIVTDIGYVGSKGTRLIVTFSDINRPIQVVNPTTPGLPSLNSRRPNQFWQRNVTGDKSIGNSSYHSLQFKAERRMARGLTFLMAYTYSKSISGPSDIGGQVGGGSFIGGIQDIYNLQNERAISGFDVTQRNVNTVLYELPFFRGSRRATRTLLAGWQVSTIMTAQSGFPAPIDFNVDTTGTGVLSRPDRIGEGNLPGDQRTWLRWFNTGAFAQTPNGRFGTSPRTGAIRLPGLVNFDFSVNKSFPISERFRPEFRTEIFNLFNHYNPDPGTVDRNIRSATFGMVGGGIRGITTRVIQLGLKLNF